MNEEYLLILDYSTGSVHLIEETPEEIEEGDTTEHFEEFLKKLGTKYGFDPEHSAWTTMEYLDTYIAKNGREIEPNNIDETIYEL